MKKQTVFIGIAAGLLVVMTSQQPSYAQYGIGGGSEVSEQTLNRCQELGIPRAQCTDAAVLQKERVGWNIQDRGSGTPLFASETGQMIILIGALGAIFGGVAGGFFVMGRKTQQEESTSAPRSLPGDFHGVLQGHLHTSQVKQAGRIEAALRLR